jgi:hypothetical protein
LARDSRLDCVRGVALWWIFLDHTTGNWLRFLTLKQFAACDAAEVFVLLAGFSAGVSFLRRRQRAGPHAARARLVRRAAALYGAHLLLFAGMAAIASLGLHQDGRTLLDDLHLTSIVSDPIEALPGILLLQHQPVFLDILPIYVVFLLGLAALSGAVDRMNFVLAGSAVLYGSVWIGGAHLAFWQESHFNLLTWQFLFVIGVALATAPSLVPRPALAWDTAALAVLLLGFVVRQARWLQATDKQDLHPLRVLSVLALAWVLCRVSKADWPGWRSRWTKPFVVCGRNALPVFCVGVPASVVLNLLFERWPGPVMQVAGNLMGAGLMLGAAFLFRSNASANAPPDRSGLARLSYPE